MLVIAFDTSTAQGGVSVLRDDEVLASNTWMRQGSHGELITTAIENCLTTAMVAASDLEGIVVGVGPGSFTGVRIAVNAARSLGFSLGRPVYTFDTLEIIANGCTRTDLPLVVLVNAHKNMIFASTFDFVADPATGGRWKRRSGLETVEPADLAKLIANTDGSLAPHICIGDGFVEYEEEIPEAVRVQLIRDSLISDFPHPDVLGRMRKFSQPLEWKLVQALYIRESGAEEKLREKTKTT